MPTCHVAFLHHLGCQLQCFVGHHIRCHLHHYHRYFNHGTSASATLVCDCYNYTHSPHSSIPPLLTVAYTRKYCCGFGLVFVSVKRIRGSKQNDGVPTKPKWRDLRAPKMEELKEDLHVVKPTTSVDDGKLRSTLSKHKGPIFSLNGTRKAIIFFLEAVIILQLCGMLRQRNGNNNLNFIQIWSMKQDTYL
ncbi:hypothetical protein K1719_035195 [Acacia pycnantha]|nr:hypothetical protein K1719_035195 [Acacia pycnantha]